jgi:hypothetical protein
MAAVAGAARVHATTASNTADTITLSQPFDNVRVTNRSAPTGAAGVNDIWVVLGASSPTAGQAESYLVQSGTSRVIQVSGYSPVTGGTAPTNTVVSLVAGAAALVAYTVEGVLGN